MRPPRHRWSEQVCNRICDDSHNVGVTQLVAGQRDLDMGSPQFGDVPQSDIVVVSRIKQQGSTIRGVRLDQPIKAEKHRDSHQ
jgi:hypothetical protein